MVVAGALVVAGGTVVAGRLVVVSTCVEVVVASVVEEATPPDFTVSVGGFSASEIPTIATSATTTPVVTIFDFCVNRGFVQTRIRPTGKQNTRRTTITHVN